MDRLFCVTDTGDIDAPRALLERFDGIGGGVKRGAATRIAEEMAAAIG